MELERLHAETAVTNLQQRLFCRTNKPKATKAVVDEVLKQLNLSDCLLLVHHVELLISAYEVASYRSVAHQNVKGVPVLKRVMYGATHVPFVTKLCTPGEEAIDSTHDDQVGTSVLRQS